MGVKKALLNRIWVCFGLNQADMSEAMCTTPVIKQALEKQALPYLMDPEPHRW